ncbi:MULTISPECIES: AraC family transcriptional regulator [unclassified Oceanispirochaeta]|uniref:AraC family transcriptional regulator n=1 Tax=unclassified Oceanispirochaeta TaxID=2635722 RepID=UPI000E097A12|nr:MULTISPECIES: AraC family transcriptional regulator [unclassified Oceanispirochaeta]MBF9016586.1 helix-turn-helix transcriptional regulator [Oceanispirochaeta sp. M2]NPD73049.1 helix-turn-helix transcriptional regulator [Oceanispirochaeta sp. M1]RDG31394.1 AraC family transcriptional regulator [Oceanispirochaeta sp. M1]
MILIYILGNVVAPAFSGLTLSIFAAYFIFTHSLTTTASRYFVVYLLSFGLFVMLRPVQLYMGPHPIPVIINSFRSLLFLGLATPALTIANLNFKFPIKKKVLYSIWIFSLTLGLIYILFNFLGVKGSRIAYFSIGLPAYEPYLPERFPPFYSREVTIMTYIVSGLMISASSFNLFNLHIFKKRKETKTERKFVFFGLGSCILGGSIILGVLLKSWWIYYMASLFSTLIAGYGIIIDIREIQLKVNRTLPYVKEELTNLIRFQPGRQEELVELFHILELNTRINTFIVMEYKGHINGLDQLDIIDRIIRDIEPLLAETSGEGCSFLIPIGRYKLGICLYLSQKNEASLEFCEKILNKFSTEKNLTTSFGIGRTGLDMNDLSDSYHDAITAQAYSSFYNKSQIIHINDVEDISNGEKRVVYDLSDLSIAVKTGNIKISFNQFHLYYAWIVKAARGDLDNLKMRAMHLVSAISQDVMTLGIPGYNMAEKSNDFFRELLQIEEQDSLRIALIRIMEETVNAVAKVQKNKLSATLINTKKYIEDHLNENLSGKEIAMAVNMSQSYLINVFKKETGLSLNDYICKMRMTRAKVLLSTTDDPITDIAYDVGFNDSNYFSTVFRKAVGHTPSTYRKLQRN